jgi:diacylglycerol kinase family enzyme
MKLLFVVNPISGGVDKEPFLKNAESLCDKYGIFYRIFKTTGKNDDAELRLVLKNFDPDKVASVGGDGTTLFTATILMGTGYPMGIIPLGSANGMATELYVNPNPVEALKDIIMSSLYAGLDMVVVNDEHYTLHLGDVGVNAGIVNAYSKDKNRGMNTYAKYFMEELKELKPFNVRVKANGQIYEEKSHMLAICNSRKYGTGVPLNAVGNPMDGKFELVSVSNINVRSLIKSGLSKFDERFIDTESSSNISCEEAQIFFEKPMLLQLDGEIIGEFTELDVKIKKAAVQLITTTSNLHLASK